MYIQIELTFRKYGNRSSHPQPSAPSCSQAAYSDFPPRTKTMPLTTEPPPTTRPAGTEKTRSFNADCGALFKLGQRYGTGKKAPGTRTLSSSLSKGPVSMTRTLTISHALGRGFTSEVDEVWHGLYLLLGSSVSRSATVSPETPPPAMTKS